MGQKKADWLDPFITKKDQYIDFYNKDEITQPECPNQYSRTFSNNDLSSYPFWLICFISDIETEFCNQ